MSGAVRQITVATDPGIPYFLRVDFAASLSDGFKLALSDGITAWNGEVSYDEVKREAIDMEVPMERYVEDLHQALTGGRRRAGDKDIYSFEFTLDRLQFSYHKMCDGIPVRLGSLKLQPAQHPVALTREMIGQSLKRNSNLANENLLLLEENCKMKEDHAQILQELELQVQGKETMTRELYTRFVMLLNEKKAKIRSLQDALSQLRPTTTVQKKQRENYTSSGEDNSPDRREDTIQDSHPSLEPTILIAGQRAAMRWSPTSCVTQQP
ncbi:DNA repair protein XRCC4-like isoform X2 [Festucalex cinctus]